MSRMIYFTAIFHKNEAVPFGGYCIFRMKLWAAQLGFDLLIHLPFRESYL